MFEYTTILDFILTFVAGLLFGLAIKKGAIAFVLTIIGFVIASYVGLTFVPKISLTYELNKFISLASTYLKDVQLGAVGLSMTIILFLIGLAIGIWKG